MRTVIALLLAFVCGCSTAPVANFLDWVAPGKARPMTEDIPIRGGAGATGIPPDPLQGFPELAPDKRPLPPLPSASRDNGIEILDPVPKSPATPQSRTAPAKPEPPKKPMDPLPPVPEATPAGYRGPSAASRVPPGRVAELDPPQTRPSADPEE